ncbi:hypothetical protein [Actinopolyspora mortivallis]|uniref:Uncharacterized protein n=1 Tax=Actinopolyspora mortivallis TaxID=33906 RepID=A0A2T0GSV8_ACTMO|nr:hypothetical protein [Actinopolyspora mortivallis]PRW62177.1 hypothetical protein CEP50_16740 [Actinopolyspora mortivallis]
MTLRPFPAESDFGRWDVLPADPTEDEIDHENPDVVDALRRREHLTENWRADLDYPTGIWREEVIEAHPRLAKAWRNWLLRRSYEGISFINGCIRRWSQENTGARHTST